MIGPGDPDDSLVNYASGQVAGFPTAILIVIEFTDEDGDTRLYCDTLRDQRANRTLGLLEWAATIERTKIAQTWLEDDGE